MREGISTILATGGTPLALFWCFLASGLGRIGRPQEGLEALKLMMDAAHRYDGYIVQSTGDGIFAIFGAPVAHEGHPQRALYAALRMQEDVKRYAEKLRAERGDPKAWGASGTPGKRGHRVGSAA
jgi:hypothetical protein